MIAPRDGFAVLMRSGRQISPVSLATIGRNPGGSTPMISCGSPLSVTIRPTTAGSPPNRRFHSASPMTATRAALGTSSSGRKVRPSAGDDAEHVEVLVRDLLAGDRLRLGAAGQGRPPAADRGDAFEECRFAAPVDVVARRRPLVSRAAARAEVLPDHHQPPGSA